MQYDQESPPNIRIPNPKVITLKGRGFDALLNIVLSLHGI